MFYSQCLVSGKGTLSAIWVAAYFDKKLKKAQVTQTDISSSVDKILKDGFDVVTYRVLAYLLLGVVRIYSKKVEYLLNDCNKMLLKLKDFLVSAKGCELLETLRVPYFSIALPASFELDAFDLGILEDTIGAHTVPREEITLQDGIHKTGGTGRYSLDKFQLEELEEDACSGGYTLNEGVHLSHSHLDFNMEVNSCKASHSRISMEDFRGSGLSQHEKMDLETSARAEEEPEGHVETAGKDCPTGGEHPNSPGMVESDEINLESIVQKILDASFREEVHVNLKMPCGDEVELVTFRPISEHHQTDGRRTEDPDVEQSENQMHQSTQTSGHQTEVLDVGESENEIHHCTQTDGWQKEIPNWVNPKSGHEELVNPIEPINEYHQTEGQQTEVLDIEQLENELHQRNQTDGHQMEVLDMEQSENEMHQSMQTDGCQTQVLDMEQFENEMHENTKDHRPSDAEASIEKLRDIRFSKKDWMDIDMMCTIEHPQHSGPYGEEQQSDVKHTKVSEMLSTDTLKCPVVMEECQSSPALDSTPQSKFPPASGVRTPEFLACPTPAAKEHTWLPKKRKCIYDDVIVLPSSFLKKCIEDATDLVCKRRKSPHTALAAWKAHQFSNFRQFFLEPLLPCTSSELRSLFYKKPKVFESVERAKRPQKFEPQCPSPVICIPVTAVDLPEKFDMLDSLIAEGSVQTIEPCVKSKVLESSVSVGPRVQKKLDMSVSHAGGSLEQTEILSESCPQVQEKLHASDSIAGGSLEQTAIKSVSCTIRKRVEIVDCQEKLNVPESPAVGVLQCPEKLKVSSSPPAGGSLEQSAIAPGTPVLHTKSVRSFERPERSGTGILDTVRTEYKNADTELSFRQDKEFDLSLINKAVHSLDGDDEDQDGLSQRTRLLARSLHRIFLNQQQRREEGLLKLSQLTDGRTKSENARLFYEILVLKTKGLLHVRQDGAYRDILIAKTSKWMRLAE